MVTTVIGTPGVNGTSSLTPTAGKKGGAAVYTYNGHIGADSMNILATGGNGGSGGNHTGGGTGANGGDGGDANITVNGNIFNSPVGPSLDVITTAIGGNGGLGGTGALSGAQGNGGNATVAINGNIIQTSKLLSEITLDAVAIGGLGTKTGNASATVNGNIIQYSNAVATNVTLDAAALINGPDSPANNGNNAFGTKTATVNGNIVSGNVNNLFLAADAYFSNGTATINGNIFTAKPANTGTVTLEATGQTIAINGNILNLGKQDLDISLNELGPIYSASVSGNIFNGTGTNNLVIAETHNPGPKVPPDTASVNLSAGTFTFNGSSNIINKFGGIALVGNVQGNFIGTFGNNTLDASGDTTTGTIIFMGNGGTDTLKASATALNVADFAGSDWQYNAPVGPGAHPVSNVIVSTIPGNIIAPNAVIPAASDTLTGTFQRLKFLSPASVSDTNDNGYGDFIFADGSGNLQVYNGGPAVVDSHPGWTVVGTGQFTADTDRNASILLQDATGDLGIESNIAGVPAFTGAILGGPAGVTASTFTGWKAITAGDFNGDAASDVLLQQGPGGPVEIAFMNTVAGQTPGTVDKISAVTSPTGGNWNVISSGDFNGDGNSDILWQNSVTGALDVSLMNGATGTPASIGTLPAGYTAIGTGDFNGDGKSDVLLENTTSGDAQIWLMNGTSQVGSPINVAGPGTTATGWALLGAEDINRDGFSDLLWQNTTSGSVVGQEMTTGGA
ncbi:MAG TPA: VCBS repeat-containing protein, partial [Rhizomicrobium sp.]|nr:VCBS repeat-containing protein [Rhizomicrobium sp.]